MTTIHLVNMYGREARYAGSLQEEHAWRCGADVWECECGIARHFRRQHDKAADLAAALLTRMEVTA